MNRKTLKNILRGQTCKNCEFADKCDHTVVSCEKWKLKKYATKDLDALFDNAIAENFTADTKLISPITEAAPGEEKKLLELIKNIQHNYR